MSELKQLIDKAKGTKKPLWQKLLDQIKEIDDAKKAGKTYKEIAAGYDVSEASFSRALKRARTEAGISGKADVSSNAKEENSIVSFEPILPDLNGAEIEEIEIDLDKVDAALISKVKAINNALNKFGSLVNELKSIEVNLIESTTESVANNAASEVMALKVKTAETEVEVKKYAADSKKYIDKITTQAISTFVKKLADVIDQKLEAATADINKKKAKYRPDKWAAMAVVGCFIIGATAFYVGNEGYMLRSDYGTAKANEKKWSKLVDKYQIATEQEKAAFESMIKREK